MIGYGLSLAGQRVAARVRVLLVYHSEFLVSEAAPRDF